MSGSHTPFQPLIGVWSGTSYVFDVDGGYQGLLPIVSVIAWRDEQTLVYRQSHPGPAEMKRFPTLVDEGLAEIYELEVAGQTIRGGNERVAVNGFEAMGTEYFFQIARRDGSRSHYNHHFFPAGPDFRRVHGPMAGPDRETRLVFKTDLRRISRLVPDHRQEA